MNALTVSLDYGMSASAPYQRDGSAGVALPVKVLDAEGTVLAEGLASSLRPIVFDIDHGLETVFVRLTWPGGRTETRRVSSAGDAQPRVSFSDAKIANNEWSAWAVPRLNRRTSLDLSNREETSNIGRYRNVWLRVWRFDSGVWHPTPMTPRMQYKSAVAKQVDLELEALPYLLQLGSSDVPWHFVALPGGGPCRVLFTSNDSSDPRSDPLKVVVTSFRTDAETLLEFLCRDAMRAARTMATSQEMAVSLFADKFNDPIAAVAGAYYLLRTGNGEQAPLNWWENLSANFSWIPDTAILHCVRLLRDGLSDQAARTKVLGLFKTSLDRGWPVYEEGMNLLREAGALLRHIAKSDDAEYFSRVELLATAKTWAGASLSFHGKTPTKPSAVLWVGTPNAPRRRRLAQPEGFDESIERNMREVEKASRSTASVVSRQMSSLSFSGDLAPAKFTRPNVTSALEFAPVPGSADGGRLPKTPTANRKVRKTPEDKGAGWMLLGDIGD